MSDRDKPLTAHAFARMLLTGPDLEIYYEDGGRPWPVTRVRTVTHISKPIVNEQRSMVLGYERVPLKPYLIIDENEGEAGEEP